MRRGEAVDFCILILSIVVLISLYPYIRCFIKRIAMALKLKKLCKRKGYRLIADKSEDIS